MSGSRQVGIAAWVVAAVLWPPAVAAYQKVGSPMNAHLQLYQFTRDGDSISVARIAGVRIRGNPESGEETVYLEMEVTETLWRDPGTRRLSYAFRRPQSPAAQMKFRDPIWGRANLRDGARLLIVNAATNNGAPVYADQVDDPDDPVMQSIRAILAIERTVTDRRELFRKRLDQLRGGTVEKLFAGEALAHETSFRPEEQTLMEESYARAFVGETDDYVKISLGSWLWDLVYPKAGSAGRSSIVNATIQAAGSPAQQVRTFALDRLTDADAKDLRDAGAKASPELIRLLEERHSAEEDAGVRRHLEEVISALRK